MVRTTCLVLISFAALAQERWDAKITLEEGVKVPFSLQFAAKDGKASASWQGVRSTAGKAENGKLTLEFAGTGSRIDADFDGKTFEGMYTVAGVSYKIEAAPYCTCGFQGEAGPDVSGVWTLENGGKLTLVRKGDDTLGELELKPDVAAKNLTGRFDGLSFALAEFDGRRGVLVDAEPGGSQSMTLTIQLAGGKPMKAIARKE